MMHLLAPRWYHRRLRTLRCKKCGVLVQEVVR